MAQKELRWMIEVKEKIIWMIEMADDTEFQLNGRAGWLISCQIVEGYWLESRKVNSGTGRISAESK